MKYSRLNVLLIIYSCGIKNKDVPIKVIWNYTAEKDDELTVEFGQVLNCGICIVSGVYESPKAARSIKLMLPAGCQNCLPISFLIGTLKSHYLKPYMELRMMKYH